jgi:hypothetical protein
MGEDHWRVNEIVPYDESKYLFFFVGGGEELS